MTSRLHPGLLGLALGLLLAAGCRIPAASPSRADGSRGSAAGEVEAPPVSSAAAADYSSGAVQARVEAHTHYATAVLHEQNDEPELAAQEFYLAAMADPSNEGMVLEATGRLLRLRPEEAAKERQVAAREKALTLLQKATANPKAGGAVWARLGLLYSMLGKKEQAVHASRKAIQQSPDVLAGYQYLAQHFLQASQPEEGIKVLQEAARRSKVDVNFLVDLAETFSVFARGGRMEAVKAPALDVLKRASALKPNNPVLLQRIADGFGFYGEVDRAVDIYLGLLERMPSLTPLRDKLVELYLRKQDRTNAATQLRAVLKESPANPQMHYLLGSILFEGRQSEEAAEHFDRTILLSPGFEPAYYDLAAAQINNNQAKEALQTLGKARGKFQESFVCEFYTSMAYSRLKDYTNALRYLTSAEVIGRVSATNRLNHTFYFQLGSVYERNHRFKEAETAFRKAIELSPDFSEALNYLGYMWAERGENLEEARQMIEKAVRAEPKNSAFLDSLGWVLFKLGKPKEALKYIEQSVETNEEPDATLFEHLGDVHAALNQLEKAREAWKKSLHLEPNPDIEKKLKNASGTSTPAGS